MNLKEEQDIVSEEFGQDPSYSPHCLFNQSEMLRKSLYKAHKGLITRHKVIFMINGFFCQCRRSVPNDFYVQNMHTKHETIDIVINIQTYTYKYIIKM